MSFNSIMNDNTPEYNITTFFQYFRTFILQSKLWQFNKFGRPIIDPLCEKINHSDRLSEKEVLCKRIIVISELHILRYFFC